jgi:hypothetical protein
LTDEEKATRAAERAAARLVAKVAAPIETENLALVTTPITGRPAPLPPPEENQYKAASCSTPDAIVWEATQFAQSGRPAQWRGWFDGSVVSVVTFAQARERDQYLVAVMAKRLGVFTGTGGRRRDVDEPPLTAVLVDLVNFAISDLLASGKLVEEAEAQLKTLRPCDAVAEAEFAYKQLVSAHEARYETDETDEIAVNAANLAVNTADAVFQAAKAAAVEAAKTGEEKAIETTKALAKFEEAFNAKVKGEAANG